MQRRTLLRGLAAAVAGAGAGCASNSREVPVTAPAPPADIGGPADEGDAGGDGDGSAGDGGPAELQFAVPERDFERDESGELVVVLTVENRGQAPRDAVMTVRIAAGEQTFDPVRHVSLTAGAEESFRIHVPVAFDALTGFEVVFEQGTPATPLPTLTRPGTAAPTDDSTDGPSTATAAPDTATGATEIGDGAGSTATDSDE